MKKIQKKLFILIFILFGTGAVFAANYTWSGSTNTNWGTASNWTPPGIPGLGDNVEIPAGCTNYPELTGDVNANSVKIKHGASLDFNNAKIICQDEFLCYGILKIPVKGTIEAKKILFAKEAPNVSAAGTAAGNGDLYLKITDNTNGSLEFKDGGIFNITELTTIDAKQIKINGGWTFSGNIGINLDNSNCGITSTHDLIFKGTVNTGINTSWNNTGMGKVTIHKDFTAPQFVHESGEFIASGNAHVHVNKLKSLTVRSGANLTIIENLTMTDKLNIADKAVFKVEKGLTIEGNNTVINNDGTIEVSDWISFFFSGSSNNEIIGSGTTKFNQLYIGDADTLTLKTNVDINQIISSSGTLTFDSNAIRKTVNFTGDDCKINVISNGSIKLYNLHINAGAKLTLNEDITIVNEFINNGKFDANNKKVTLKPNNTITITGTINGNDTKFHDLVCEHAGGKTVKINNKISVNGDLKLTGIADNALLSVEGGNNSEIKLNLTQTNNGKYLKVSTNIPISDGTTYTTQNSKPDGSESDIQAGKPKNWIFEDCISELIWTGENDSNWNNNNNWRPRQSHSPKENQDTRIIRNSNNQYPNLGVSTNAKAKSVKIETNAILDLADKVITATGANKSTVDNSGTLKLTGTADQKAWFEENSPKKITLQANSTVEYYGNSNDNVWGGPYENLKLENRAILKTNGNLRVNEKLHVSNSDVVIECSSSNIKSIEINYDAKLALNSDIIITKSFKNNGKFDANNKKVTLNPSVNVIVTIINGSAGDTKFHILECLGAGGKTLEIKGKITITEKLDIGGTSDNSSLTLTGDGSIEIPADKTAPPNSPAKYLQIFTDNLKIANPYFVRYGIGNSKNGWIFLKENLSIKNSFASPGDNHIYVLFENISLEDIKNHFNTPDGCKLIVKKTPSEIFTSTNTITEENLTNIPSNCSLLKFELDNTITADNILDKNYMVEFKYYTLTSKTKKYISDIGINMVTPLFASNSITIRKFDGTMWLPKLDTTVSCSKTASSDNIKLYFFSKPSLEHKFWVKTLPPSPPHSSISVFAETLPSATEYPPSLENNKVKFTISENDSHFIVNNYGGFMFLYDDWLPCARLEDENDILSFDVWHFEISGVQKQKGKVSIFNNVINTSNGETMSIEVRLPRTGMLTVQVVSIDGNIVSTIERSHKNKGNFFYEWDGRNAGGNPVARGMYFIRIAGPDIDEIRKVLVIR